MRIGHTDADAPTAHAAFDRGASAITHIHNAHRRFAARDPGPAGAALARDDVTVTTIVDGVDLAEETVAMVRRVAGPRLCLVSDAIAAAGLGDGCHRLGELRWRSARAARPSPTARWPAASAPLDRAAPPRRRRRPARGRDPRGEP